MSTPRRVRLLALAVPCALLLGATPSPEAPPAPGAAAPSDTFALEVEATGFANEQGHAVALLFLPGSNVMRKEQARATLIAEIHGGAAHFHFPDLTPGRYALVVFHDANDNGVIDHGLFGPIEQLGFSSGFRPGLRHGLPSFEKLQVELARPAGSASVQLAIAVR
jgi:uncharacterized protein (DUF2141 family)